MSHFQLSGTIFHWKRMPFEFFSLKNKIKCFVLWFILQMWVYFKSQFVALSFSGLIQGESGEYPLHVSFQPSFDKGALLSIVSVNYRFKSCKLEMSWLICNSIKKITNFTLCFKLLKVDNLIICTNSYLWH